MGSVFKMAGRYFINDTDGIRWPSKQGWFPKTKLHHSIDIKVGSFSFSQIYYYTSSTAQGGGGSFKKWKTYRRGELVWRKNGRANPLMDRKVLEVSHSCSLFLWLSTYLPIYLLSIYLSIDLSLSLSLSSNYPSIYLSIHPSIYLSFYPSVYLSVECSCSCRVVECSVV